MNNMTRKDKAVFVASCALVPAIPLAGLLDQQVLLPVSLLALFALWHADRKVKDHYGRA